MDVAAIVVAGISSVLVDYGNVQTMIILVTGDRKFDDSQEVVLRAIHSVIEGVPPSDVLVVHGGAPGADIAAESVKILGIHTARVDAIWNFYHRAAGPIRNRAMAKFFKIDKALVFHDNLAESKGTKDMVSVLERLGIPYGHYNSSGELLNERR